jgi:aryl-alcohol dehydrogenase-like predicted oxidoreductase
MEYRTLGKTGLKVSVVGFGGIPIQRVSAAEANAIVNRALDLGINFFDTARAKVHGQNGRSHGCGH